MMLLSLTFSIGLCASMRTKWFTWQKLWCEWMFYFLSQCFLFLIRSIPMPMSKLSSYVRLRPCLIKFQSLRRYPIRVKVCWQLKEAAVVPE